MNKIKLKVLGLSYSQTQSGAYALVLEAVDSEHRIPIIIGSFEAQAIAIHLEKLKPPRPLTHDLFISMAKKLKFWLKEVQIYKLEEGVFHSRLMVIKNNNIMEIDARTSDAVALALRFDCPIYTTQEIIDKAGLIINLEGEDEDKDQDTKGKKQSSTSNKTISSSENLSYKSLEELNEMLQKAIEQEAYEQASKISDEINKRNPNKK
ncbi:MAG: bifunctional nuclease domain-containing protein [Bacteroidota bacterium]|nr:bifunctional nuclease domain-containing protein [Bacteroidota bacterium]